MVRKVGNIATLNKYRSVSSNTRQNSSVNDDIGALCEITNFVFVNCNSMNVQKMCPYRNCTCLSLELKLSNIIVHCVIETNA